MDVPELIEEQRAAHGFALAAPDNPEVIAVVREAASRLQALCPAGQNLSLALAHLEDVRMRANAAIALDGVPAAPQA